MTTLAERLFAHGIRSRSYAEGNHKLPCPRCSYTRRKRDDPCLSLTIERDQAIWKCHHCQWSGAVNEREDERWTQPRRRRPAALVKPARSPDQATAAVLAWFARRGISEATVRRNRVGASRNYVPALGAEVDCIAFPYFRAGELVNIKFRATRSPGSIPRSISSRRRWRSIVMVGSGAFRPQPKTGGRRQTIMSRAAPGAPGKRQQG